MPHCYSTFWLDFCAGAPLRPIWGWKDRARALPSWAPLLLAELEASGCVTAAAQACGRSLRTVALARALLPGLGKAWDAALSRYQAAQLPIRQQRDALPIGNSPIGEFRAGAEFAHPLEALPMEQWIRLSHAEQVAVVAEYAGRTLRPGGAGDVRYRGGR